MEWGARRQTPHPDARGPGLEDVPADSQAPGHRSWGSAEGGVMGLGVRDPQAPLPEVLAAAQALVHITCSLSLWCVDG